MKRILLTSVAFAALVSIDPAAALDRPEPIDPREPQIRRQAYNQYGRTEIIGNPTRSTIITFGPEDSIKRVVQGNGSIMSVPSTEEVQQAPLTNVLPLWGNAEGRTTLQVVTQRPGKPDRVHQLSAVVRQIPPECAMDGTPQKSGIHPCDDDPQATYGLFFTYPEDEKERKAQAAAEARREALVRVRTTRVERERQTVTSRLETDFTCVNGFYQGVGDKSIAPDDACDDGQHIGLLFKGARPVPSVFLVDRDGKEPRAIRVQQRGDWTIVPVLRERIRLILGERQVVDIVNRAYSRQGNDSGTGTGSPDVAREVVQAPGGARR